jgi:hypothetical protein
MCTLYPGQVELRKMVRKEKEGLRSVSQGKDTTLDYFNRAALNSS